MKPVIFWFALRVSAVCRCRRLKIAMGVGLLLWRRFRVNGDAVDGPSLPPQRLRHRRQLGGGGMKGVMVRLSGLSSPERRFHAACGWHRKRREAAHVAQGASGIRREPLCCGPSAACLHLHFRKPLPLRLQVPARPRGQRHRGRCWHPCRLLVAWLLISWRGSVIFQPSSPGGLAALQRPPETPSGSA